MADKRKPNFLSSPLLWTVPVQCTAASLSHTLTDESRHVPGLKTLGPLKLNLFPVFGNLKRWKMWLFHTYWVVFGGHGGSVFQNQKVLSYGKRATNKSRTIWQSCVVDLEVIQQTKWKERIEVADWLEFTMQRWI